MLPSCVRYNLTAEFSDIYNNHSFPIHSTIVFLMKWNVCSIVVRRE